MKQFLIFFFILMVTILLCTSCEKRRGVDTIVRMFDDGIETVDKAKSVDDVQKCYNDINKRVDEFKQSHLREMASIDSIEIKIEKAENIFTKACCIKAFSFGGYIKNTEGVEIGVDITGEVLPIECIEGDDGLVSEDFENDNIDESNNPLGFIHLTPEYEYRKNQFSENYYWYQNYITVQNTEGDYLYSDEDAEHYYNYYLGLFFMAYQIFYGFDIENEELREYLKENFTVIISNLPLDESFPENIREFANKIYYDHKDEMSTMHIRNRGYGYVQCAYYFNCNQHDSRVFYLRRDKEHNGRFIITRY